MGFRCLDWEEGRHAHNADTDLPLFQPTSSAFVDNYLIISFTVAILIAMLAPSPGAATMGVVIAGSVHVVESINIMLVFLASGLTLKAGDARAAVTEWRGIVWGLLSILAISPLLGFGLAKLPLVPPEYTTGITVMAAVPTTLGINLALARPARANVSLSTLLTVASNLLGTVTIPLWLKATLPHGPEGGPPAGLRDGGVSISNLLVRLVVTVMVPTLIGAGSRALFPPVARTIDAHKPLVSLFSTTNLAFVVWQSLSVARPFLVSAPPISLLWIFLVSLGMQAVYYPLNFAAVVLLRLKAKEAAAVTITASQKSAPVAVAVVASLAASTDALGLMSVPAIICQLTQVFSNQPLAYVFRAWTKRSGVASTVATPAPSVAGGARGGRAGDVEAGKQGGTK